MVGGVASALVAWRVSPSKVAVAVVVSSGGAPTVFMPVWTAPRWLPSASTIQPATRFSPSTVLSDR